MTPTLTGISRAIADLRGLPVEDRRAAAAALIDDLTEVLACRVEDAVVCDTWVRLARYGTGQTVERPADPDAARAAALAALAATDPLVDVADARRIDEQAREAAERARAALRAAVVRAIEAGAAHAHVAAAAGISRQNIYAWTEPP